jgi:hypothetical protein
VGLSQNQDMDMHDTLEEQFSWENEASTCFKYVQTMA